MHGHERRDLKRGDARILHRGVALELLPEELFVATDGTEGLVEIDSLAACLVDPFVGADKQAD
ncbi:hypothetical protein D3C71_1893840 [compost metagenome]